jgi:hypothetical protein
MYLEHVAHWMTHQGLKGMYSLPAAYSSPATISALLR